MCDNTPVRIHIAGFWLLLGTSLQQKVQLGFAWEHAEDSVEEMMNKGQVGQTETKWTYSLSSLPLTFSPEGLVSLCSVDSHNP